MDEQDYKALILYYGREKFYHLMQLTSLEALHRNPDTICFRLFNGFALVLGNRIQEGIRELNPIQSENEYAMSAILALIYAHKRCTIIDKEALYGFDGRLKDERKKLTSNSAYYSAIFLFLSGKYEKSKEYVERAIKLNAESIDAMVLHGWTQLQLQLKINKSILEIFNKALLMGKNVDANLGQIKYYQLINDFDEAITILNKLSIRYPELNMPLVEKMKCQMANWNCEHALETASRILTLEPNNIEALRVKCLINICRFGDFTVGLSTINQLYLAMDKIEPTNCELYLQIGQLFSRVCGRNTDILKHTFKFVEKSVQLSPNNAEYTTELGYQSILREQYKDAIKYFRLATKLDDSSIYALCGLTLCQIIESNGGGSGGTTGGTVSEQVKQQIEFLDEIQGTTKNSLLLYMTAKIQLNNTDKAINYLVESSEIQFKNLKTISYGCEYLRYFNPDFLLIVIEELLRYTPVQTTIIVGPTISKENLHISLKHSLNILEVIVKACPGIVPAVFQLAKVEFLCGDLIPATVTLQKILKNLDPTFTDAHLLQVQIFIQQKQLIRAAQTLEICLSHNFKVRDSPMYHLLNGVIKKNQTQYDESLKCFTTALNICNVFGNDVQKFGSSPNKGKSMNLQNVSALSIADKVTLYLEMVETYMLLNQNTEAEKFIQIATTEFAGTSEEGRLIIANANLMQSQGYISKVIELLKSIQPGQTYYLQAKTKLANVYLHQKKDRLSFTQCFKELVENCPVPESYLMLGDAYMSIQEPDEAISAYKEALRKSPHDPLLASKLGRAYVKTHQYAKAINYYHEATSDVENPLLKLDLAELYLKLKQFSNAEQTLVEEIDAFNKNGDTDHIGLLQTRTKQLLLLARIRERSGYLNASLTTLKEARDNQYRITKRINLEQSAGLPEQQKIISKICILMAEQSIGIRDNHQAIIHYTEALKYSVDDVSIMAAIARLYMQMNNMDKCQETCGNILQIDSNNEAASVMMADISFRRMDFDNAAYHFSQLLLSQPTYWTALARLIEVMRRSATLQDVPPFLLRAEQNTIKSVQEAGLNYCKGLFEWYSGNPNIALRYFNNARRDNEWGQQSIYNMIEICINPDGDLPNENTLENGDDMDFKDSRTMALRTAERLLKELKPRPGGLDNEALNLQLLKNFLNLATRQKYAVESALNEFTTIASQEEYKDHVGPILGMASAYILLKQSQRARNQLKRVAKNTWTFEDAEYLERCWLLLADIYIQSNKNDLASELLQKIIEHNKSCAKAYEFCGYISEKEQSYRAAAFHYDLAWRYGGKSKPAIGYKLAYNYMKTKKYADAIDVCQQVLKLHPDYPSIKKDILDKCRNNLRS